MFSQQWSISFDTTQWWSTLYIIHCCLLSEQSNWPFPENLHSLEVEKMLQIFHLHQFCDHTFARRSQRLCTVLTYFMCKPSADFPVPWYNTFEIRDIWMVKLIVFLQLRHRRQSTDSTSECKFRLICILHCFSCSTKPFYVDTSSCDCLILILLAHKTRRFRIIDEFENKIILSRDFQLLTHPIQWENVFVARLELQFQQRVVKQTHQALRILINIAFGYLYLTFNF